MSKTSTITNSYNEGEKCNLMIRGYEKVLKYSTLFKMNYLEKIFAKRSHSAIQGSFGGMVMLATNNWWQFLDIVDGIEADLAPEVNAWTPNLGGPNSSPTS